MISLCCAQVDPSEAFALAMNQRYIPPVSVQFPHSMRALYAVFRWPTAVSAYADGWWAPATFATQLCIVDHLFGLIVVHSCLFNCLIALASANDIVVHVGHCVLALLCRCAYNCQIHLLVRTHRVLILVLYDCSDVYYNFDLNLMLLRLSAHSTSISSCFICCVNFLSLIKLDFLLAVLLNACYHIGHDSFYVRKNGHNSWRRG